MTQINAGLVLGIAGTLSGLLMATLALAISSAPGWRELRSFALIAISAAAYCFFDLVQILQVSWRTLAIGESLALAASFLYGIAWIRHLAISERRPLRRMERGLIVAGVVMVVLAFIPGVLITPPIRHFSVAWLGVRYTQPTGTSLGVGCVVFNITAILVASFGGDRRWRDGWHARLPMVGAMSLMLAGVSAALAFWQIIPMPAITEAATVAIVGAMGVSYARRFIADAGRLEALSTRLEHEVASRTDELLNARGLVEQHERLAGLGRIAAGVAHEVNNPTMVIQQNLDRMRTLLAADKTLTPELAMRFDRSRAATQQIAEIVRQLLETGRRSGRRPCRRAGSPSALRSTRRSSPPRQPHRSYVSRSHSPSCCTSARTRAASSRCSSICSSTPLMPRGTHRRVFGFASRACEMASACDSA